MTPAGRDDDDQRAAPIVEAIEAFRRRQQLSFTIPAHLGGLGRRADIAALAGADALRADVSMACGVDTRDLSLRVQDRAQRLYARATGARQTLFSTNGSTLSVHVALMATAGPGQTVVVARNSHKSVFSALVMSGAHPAYVEATADDDLEIALAPRAEDVDATLRAHPDARAVMLTSPSIYGVCADIGAVVEVVREHGLPLVVDEAWAAHYAIVRHPALPHGALRDGADLVIGSVHKGLSGLSQTSVLSVGSDRIDLEHLRLCFELENSTSASALLLASIDSARREFVRDGQALVDGALRSAERLRARLREDVPELRVVSVEDLVRLAGVRSVDPTHVVIDVRGVGLTGYEADDWLRDECQIDFQLSDHRRLLARITWAHEDAHIDRLVSALRALVNEIGGPVSTSAWPRLLALDAVRTEHALSPRDAFFAASEHVPAATAVGRVSCELLTPYPPGVPLIAPGEVFTHAILTYLAEFLAAGGMVEGAEDPQLASVRVVARA